MSDQSAAVPAPVRFAARHVNVSASNPVTSEEFFAALTGKRKSEIGDRALRAFLGEADPAELADLVACGAVSFRRLAELARTLPPDHPNRRYLDELAA